MLLLKMCLYTLVKCTAPGNVFFVRTMLTGSVKGGIQVFMRGRGKKEKKQLAGNKTSRGMGP